MHVFDTHNAAIVADPDEREAAFAAAARFLAQGRAVVILPAEGEMALPDAADFLNVSAAFMDRLLDEGALPSRGRRSPARFVSVRDLAAYRVRRDADRREALQAMVDQAQELDLYD